MKLNLDRYIEQELNLLDAIIQETGDWKQIDIHAYESVEKFEDQKLILVTYGELLGYGYVYRAGASGDKKTCEEVVTPWLACRIELDGVQTTKGHGDVLKALKKWTEKLPWKPFYDEDATHGIFRMTTSPYGRDETRYTFYVNPDYPNGWWENHTL
jgi:hypothetical protein